MNREGMRGPIELPFKIARNSEIARKAMKRKTLVCALVIGAFVLGGSNPSPSQKKDDAPKVAKKGDNLAKLGKERRDAAEKAYKAGFKYEGEAGLHNGLTYHLSVQWLHAELDLATKKQERTTAYAAHFQRMKDWEDDRKGGFRIADHPYLAVIVSCQKEAEYWLSKERWRKD